MGDMSTAKKPRRSPITAGQRVKKVLRLPVPVTPMREELSKLPSNEQKMLAPGLRRGAREPKSATDIRVVSFMPISTTCALITKMSSPTTPTLSLYSTKQHTTPTGHPTPCTAFKTASAPYPYPQLRTHPKESLHTTRLRTSQSRGPRIHLARARNLQPAI